MSRYSIDPFLFSSEERKILEKLVRFNKPLLLAQETGIPRSTVYFILKKLKKRGLVQELLINNKKKWVLNKNKELVTTADKDTAIKVYRTRPQIYHFLDRLISEDKDRLKAFSGGDIARGWKRDVGLDKIIEFNNVIKEKSLISEFIASEKYFKNQIKEFGTDWAVSHSGRPSEFHVLPDKYMAHSAQIFTKGESIYFADMDKPIVIEIRNASMKKMIEYMFDFIKDTTKSTDINEYIRNIIKHYPTS